MSRRIFCLALLLSTLATPAWAACNNPAGNEGELLYNDDHNVMQFCDGTNWVGMAGGITAASGSLTDGNKTDITVSGTGATWTINNSAVTYAKIQNTATESVLLGRGAGSGAGAIQELILGSGLTLTGTTLSASGSGGTASAAGAAGYVQLSDGAGDLTYSGTTAGQQLFWDNTNKRLGIGTANPAFSLDVAGTGNTVIASRTYSGSNSYTPHFIGFMARGTEGAPSYPLNNDWLATFQGRSGLNAAAWPGMSIVASENHSATEQGAFILFSTIPNGTTTTIERLRINQNGNVGIGTASPIEKLSIGNAISLHDGGHKAIAFQGAYPDASGWDRQNGAAYQGLLGFDPDNGLLYLSIAGSDNANMVTTANNKLTITSAGNVGIGTASPATALEVKKDWGGSPPSQIAARATGSGSAGIAGISYLSQGYSDASPWMTYAYNSATGRFCIGRNGVNEPFCITDTGNVGIGTTSPSAKLDVSGPIASHGVTFPWRWYAYANGFMFASTTWVDAPGSTISFTLPANADVEFRFDGTVFTNVTGLHCVLDFNVDGARVGDATYGSQIIMGSTHHWWSAASRSHVITNMAAGAHTVKIQGRVGSGTIGSSADCRTDDAGYSRLRLSVVAYPVQ